MKNRPPEFLECGASGGVQTLEILERIQVGKKKSKKSSRIPLPFSKRASRRGNNAFLERHFCLQNPSKNQGRDFCDTSRAKIIFSERSKKNAWDSNGKHFWAKRGLPLERCRKVQKLFDTSRVGARFFGKMAQTRTAEGDPHRILENITFERR